MLLQSRLPAVNVPFIGSKRSQGMKVPYSQRESTHAPVNRNLASQVWSN